MKTKKTIEYDLENELYGSFKEEEKQQFIFAKEEDKSKLPMTDHICPACRGPMVSRQTTREHHQKLQSVAPYVHLVGYYPKCNTLMTVKGQLLKEDCAKYLD